MTEIIKNISIDDFNNFKDEILKKIRDLETKLTNKISNKELILNTDYQTFTSKINLLMNNNKEMISTLISQKLNLQKISELESFRNKVDSMLITHEIRIKKNIEEIEKIKTKYDKIVSDNLLVSGYIGNSCQFRNLSEYLNFNIAEVSRLKMERDQFKKDIKELKKNRDGLMKTIVNMNDNTAKFCNNYTDNKKEDFQKALDFTQSELNQKNLDMRAIVQKCQNDSDQKVIEMREEINKLIQSENNLNNLINDNFYICEKKHDEINKLILTDTGDINTHKKILDTIEEKIQNLQLKLKNYDTLNSRVTKIYEIFGHNLTRANMLKYSPINSNKMVKTISQSPPPNLQKKNSNPYLIKLKTENINNIKIVKNEDDNVKNTSPGISKKNIRNAEIKKLNINTIKSDISEKEKEKKNILLQVDTKNNSIKENKKTLPILTLSGNRNSKLIEYKTTETEKNNSLTNDNIKINNIIPVISNDSQTQTNNINLLKMKTIGSEINPDKYGYKVVSLELSQNSDKDSKINIFKSANTKTRKANIFNSIINEHRAKLFTKSYSGENDISNEILDMPKRVSQAFGRTTYTFYYKKDVMNAVIANKNINNFGYNGPIKGYNFSNDNKAENNNNYKSKK